eukprot:m.8256 g.8256  ORF g.8256 m.8256 type:complete len:431 (-) comp3860_c0_seq2:3026-4318(-)
METKKATTALSRGEVLTIAGLFIGWSFSYFCRIHLFVVADEYREDVQQNLQSYARMNSLGYASYAVGKLAYGVPVDRYGGKQALLFNMVGSSLCTVLFSGGSSVWYFELMWILLRGVQPAGWIGLVKVAGKEIHESRMGRAMAVLTLSFSVGDLVARQTLAAFLHAGLSWRGIFVVSASATLLAALPVYFLVTDSRQSSSKYEKTEPSVSLIEESNDTNNEHTVATKSFSSSLQSCRPLLKKRVLWLMCALMFCMNAIRETFQTYSAEYLQNEAKMSPSQAAFTSGLFSLMGIPATILVGFVVDSLKKRRRGYVVPFFLLPLTVTLALLATAKNPSRALATSLIAICGFLTIGPYSLCCGTMIVEAADDLNVGVTAGIIDFFGSLGAIGIMQVSGMGYETLFKALLWLGILATVVSIALGKEMSKGTSEK